MPVWCHGGHSMDTGATVTPVEGESCPAGCGCLVVVCMCEGPASAHLVCDGCGCQPDECDCEDEL